MAHQSSETAGQDSSERERLCRGRDSVARYLEARGLAGLIIACQVYHYRQALEGNDERRRTHHIKLGWKRAVLAAKPIGRVLWHSLAVIWMSGWQALSKTTMQTLRTTPVTLAAMILLFVTSDAWKIFGNEQLAQVIVILAAVLAVSVFFFFAGSDNKIGSWTSDIIPNPHHDNIRQLARQTKSANDLVHLHLAPADLHLGRSGLFNVRTIYVILIIINFLAVGFWAAFALVFFGILIFGGQAQAGLLDVEKVHPVIGFTAGGYPVAITQQLILVSVMLAGIAVLTFAATGLQDPRARDAFVKPNIEDLKSCISAFYFYQAAVNIVGVAGPPGTSSPGRPPPSVSHVTGPPVRAEADRRDVTLLRL